MRTSPLARPHAPRLAALALSALLVPALAACGDEPLAPASGVALPGGLASPSHRQLVAAPCPAGTATGTTCGRLDVPLAADPATVVSLLVAQVADPGGGGGAEPLLVLPSEPGRPLVADLAAWRGVARAAGRDVVLVDRRGAGGSTPGLTCPDADVASLVAATAAAAEAYGAALAACATALAQAGTDPGHFAAAAVAGDLEAVRQAVGAERWHVLAGAASLPVVEALAASRPGTLASVTVDLTGADTATPSSLADAAAAEAVLTTDPSSATNLAAVLAAAARGEVRTSSPATSDDDAPTAVVIDPASLEVAVQAALRLGGTERAAAVLERAAAGDPTAVVALLRDRFPHAPRWSAGVTQVASCEARPAAEVDGGDAPSVAPPSLAWALVPLASASCDGWVVAAPGLAGTDSLDAIVPTHVLRHPWTTVSRPSLAGAAILDVAGDAGACVLATTTAVTGGASPPSCATSAGTVDPPPTTVATTTPPAPRTTVAVPAPTTVATTAATAPAGPPPTSASEVRAAVRTASTQPRSTPTATTAAVPAPVPPTAPATAPATTVGVRQDVEPTPATAPARLVPVDVEDGSD